MLRFLMDEPAAYAPALLGSGLSSDAIAHTF
jgi:hypothetical protein